MNVLVSRCLLGEPCRWHGRKLSVSSYLRRYLRDHPEVKIVPVCPEMLGGFGVPRPPVKRLKGRVYTTCPDKARRREVTGEDVTEAFQRGACATLRLAQAEGCTDAILCKWSPSCDVTGVTGRLLQANGVSVLNTF